MSRIATGRRRVLAVAAGGTVPVITDIEIVNSVSSGLVNAGITFAIDGTLEKRHNASFILMGDDDATVPVDHTGESGVAGGALWEVACISEDSGSWDFEEAAVGVYSDLSLTRSWRENRSGGKGYTPGTNTVTATFRFREVADTGNFVDFEVICTAIQT